MMDWAPCEEGEVTASGPEGSKGERSYWNTEWWLCGEDHLTGAEALRKETQPTPQDLQGKGQENKNGELTLLPPSTLLPVPQ